MEVKLKKFRIEPDNLLDIQVSAFCNSIPSKIKVEGKNKTRIVELSSHDINACKLAIWHIIKRAHGLHYSIKVGYWKYRDCNQTNVQRVLRQVFPPNYFSNLEKSKNYNLMREIKDFDKSSENELKG